MCASKGIKHNRSTTSSDPRPRNMDPGTACSGIPKPELFGSVQWAGAKNSLNLWRTLVCGQKIPIQIHGVWVRIYYALTIIHSCDIGGFYINSSKQLEALGTYSEARFRQRDQIIASEINFCIKLIDSDILTFIYKSENLV